MQGVWKQILDGMPNWKVTQDPGLEDESDTCNRCGKESSDTSNEEDAYVEVTCRHPVFLHVTSVEQSSRPRATLGDTSYPNMSRSSESVIYAHLPLLTKKTLEGTNSVNTRDWRFPAQSGSIKHE